MTKQAAHDGFPPTVAIEAQTGYDTALLVYVLMLTVTEYQSLLK